PTPEVMPNPPTYQQSLLKPIPSLQYPLHHLPLPNRQSYQLDYIKQPIPHQHHQTFFFIPQPIPTPTSLQQLHNITKIHYFFLNN
ncbi:hypothetical protein, partial [Staphylococcus epidermidis]|uniref:hypothetical protein n=1 Tax=Staphylococcus epidermidis TaxID=1282 RepID=UPI001642FC8B